MVGRIDHLFKDAIHVTEAQVLQQKRGEAVFRIVRSPDYDDRPEEQLRRECAKRFGDRLQLVFDYVSRLPRASRGKLRLVINEIEDARIDTND